MAIPTLNALLLSMVEQDSRELHLKANAPASVRLGGKLVPFKIPPLSAGSVKQIIYSGLRDRDKFELEKNLTVEVAFGIKGLSRFLASIYYQSGNLSALYRRMPWDYPIWKRLDLPDFLESPRPGLHLIGGKDAYESSLLLGSYLNHFSSSQSGKSSVFSRSGGLFGYTEPWTEHFGVGSDLHSVDEIVQRVLSAGGDLVAFEAINSRAGRREILETAFRGVPVVATVLGRSAEEVIANFTADFPVHHLYSVRNKLSRALRWILVWEELPTFKPRQVCYAHEVLEVNQHVRRMIETPIANNITRHLIDAPESGRSRSIYLSLKELLDQIQIDYDTALLAAPDPDLLKEYLGKRGGDRRAGRRR